MAEVIRMPRMSDTMTEGVIVEWHKKVGDNVKPGDLLAEVETDKATMELESYQEGTILHIGADKGKSVKVEDVIAVIGKPGEDISGALGDQGATAQPATAANQAPSETNAAPTASQNTNQSGSGAGQPEGGQPANQSTANQSGSAASKPADGQPATSQPTSATAQSAGQSTANQSGSETNKPSAGQPASAVAQSASQSAAPQTNTVTAPTASVTPEQLGVTVIRMPLLSDTMTEGKIVAWHKKVGDKIKSDDNIADVETDKATMEVVPYAEGTLLYVGVPEGNAAKVNEVIAILGKEGTDVGLLLASLNNTSAPAASGNGSVNSSDGQASTPAASNEGTSTAPVTAEPAANGGTGNGRVKASPLARKLAGEKGIDLNLVKGSGDYGRIIKKDINDFVPPAKEERQAAAQPAGSVAVPASVAASGTEGYTDISLSQMRKTIARRLSESMFGAPHFYLTMEINMDQAMAARAQMNEISPVKISFNDLVVKAAAVALRKHPAVNSSWMNDSIRQWHHVHVGIAVAIEDGLIVPVIRFADQKSLSQIAAESKDLSGKARGKKLQPQEFTGNTFTISNLGMMDIEEFTAIINPPDSCIMAVGRIKETVVKKGEGFGVTNVMKVTLSCDHRTVDGALGAAFLQTFKQYLENPINMLV